MTASTITVDTDTGEVTSEDGELFDPKPFTIPVPQLDGHRADTLKLAFAGNVDIDKMDNEALDHFKSLRFGQEVELRISGTVGKTGWALKTDSEGQDTVTHTLGISVHSYQVDSEG